MRKVVWIMSALTLLMVSGCGNAPKAPEVVNVFDANKIKSGGVKKGAREEELKVPEKSVVEEIPAVCESNGVFSDITTRLMWQDASYTDIEDGAYKQNQSKGKVGTWAHAKHYCSRLFFHGHSDWRLPTSDELSSLHDRPAQHFMNYRDGDFWTSTPSGTEKYYVIYPADAYRYSRNKKEVNYIRCVRCSKRD
ncbi:MAG TPA: DUF1566 domain-containing protein [Epsilonproteobacteria bacterium]|nr:DUF1566 domain-containing protein [Campylobacterota bacterium]